MEKLEELEQIVSEITVLQADIIDQQKEIKYLEKLKIEKEEDMQNMIIDICVNDIRNLASQHKIQKNYKIMIKLYEIAITKLDSNAMFELGLYYEGIEDFNNMYYYYHMSMDHNNEKAVSRLGLHYEKNKNGIEMYKLGKKYELTNTDIAIKCYQFAAKQRNAMYRLGLCYKIKKNYTEMSKWYYKASKLEHTEAIENLFAYLMKINNKKQTYTLVLKYKNNSNDTLMVKFCQLAIKQNSSDAMYELGSFYQQHKRYTEMITYYCMAIEHDNVNAEKNLINHIKLHYTIAQIMEFAKENMIKNNYKVAMAIYKIAAQLKNYDAMCELAKYYEHNNDINNAIKYYVMCNENGSPIATHKIATYYQKIKNYPDMLKYYLVFISSADKEQVHQIMQSCHKQNKIKEFNQLYDKCLDILYEEKVTDECPICLDGYGKCKTICCNQHLHYACLIKCNTCPMCRAETYLNIDKTSIKV